MFHIDYYHLFFADKLKGQKDSMKNKMTIELSLESEDCLYKIVKGEKDKIILNDGWKGYLQKNYKIIKSWIYYKIIYFLQKRNPMYQIALNQGFDVVNRVYK